MRIFRTTTIIALGAFMSSIAAQAQSADSAEDGKELRGEIFCFPAKKVPKLVKNLGKIDDSRRDIVDVGLMPRFLVKDGGDWPERFFIRTEAQEFDIPVETPSGETPKFLETVTQNPDGDVCVQDKARAERPKNDEGLYFEMGLSPLFHNKSGAHDMAELEEGTKDGKKFYKKMIPSPLRMIMPDTKHLAIRYDDFRDNAQIFARVAGQEIKLEAEQFKDMHVISLDSLVDMTADALIIKGGDYQLQPTVSAELMKRFGWGEDADNEDDKG